MLNIKQKELCSTACDSNKTLQFRILCSCTTKSHPSFEKVLKIFSSSKIFLLWLIQIFFSSWFDLLHPFILFFDTLVLAIFHLSSGTNMWAKWASSKGYFRQINEINALLCFPNRKYLTNELNIAVKNQNHYYW